MRPGILHASSTLWPGHPPEAKEYEERHLKRTMGEALIDRILKEERAFVLHPINRVEVLGPQGLTLHWNVQIDEITLDERGYTFIGGPADKQAIQTGGAPWWRVPVITPVWQTEWDRRWSDLQGLSPVKSLIATYRREGIVYMFDRFEEWG